MTIKKGTVLKGKEGWEDATYQGNVGDVHFVVSEIGTALIFSTQELQACYELPKEQWVPEKWDKFCTIMAGAVDGVFCDSWTGNRWNKAILANGFVYKTREEALDAVKRARGDV